MEDQAADRDENETADAHGCEPGSGEKRAGTHDLLDVERGVEEEDTERAVLEEESCGKPLHALDVEHVAREQWLLSDPALDVDKGAQEDPADDERDQDIGCGPALWCMATVCESEDNKDEAWDHGYQAPPVHLDTLPMLVLRSVRYAEVCYDAHDGEDDSADPEEPSPCRELC